MQATKWLIGGAFLLGWGASASGAELVLSGSAASTNASSFNAEMRHIGGPGLLDSNWVFVNAGTNRYAFVAPAGLRFDVSAGSRAVLYNSESTCTITFRVRDLGVNQHLTVEAAKALLLAEEPKAAIVQSLSACANGQPGPAFEAEWFGPGGMAQCARIAFIPWHGCVLEFAAICSRDTLSQGQRALSTVMLTFRASEPNGKLELPELSDKI